MLLTRSIRRKFAVGLSLLLVVICLLSVGSISGLTNYKRMVKELDVSLNQAPRNSDLVANLSLLFKPLHLERDIAGELSEVRQSYYDKQQRDCEQILAKVRQLVDGYFRQLNAFSTELDLDLAGQPALTQEPIVYGYLRDDLRSSLDHYEQHIPLLSDEARRGTALQYMTRMVNESIADVRDRAPEPTNKLLRRLENARRDYGTHLVVVWVTSAVGISFFLGLMVCAARWVITPIRDLHRGALRVADGDFDYRLKLSTNDEISELADAFNHMTERFQTIKSELDQQVQQQTRQLVQSAKLAGVGFLASGVAHEINNPLQAIATAAEALEFRLCEVLQHTDAENAETIRDYLLMMQTEASRCRQITGRLLDFARGKESERNLYDVTAIIRDVVAMVGHVGRYRGRTVHFEMHDPHYATVNGSETKQVILNLVANALEATDEDGAVTLDIRDCPDAIEVTCRDNGCGMTPEVLEHLFDPFFTTKQAAKGTGLGLSISHRIVQDHAGTLEARSDGPGRGSTFRLRLPKDAAQKAHAA